MRITLLVALAATIVAIYGAGAIEAHPPAAPAGITHSL
jgi:hypothetical protein